MKRVPARFSVLFILFAAGLPAQISGDVKGVVADPSGGAVAQARLTLTHRETGLARAQLSDAGGRFAFDQLRVGEYDLKVEAAGFRLASTAASVRSGETADVTFRLELGMVTETVVVTGAASPVDNTNSQIHVSVEGAPLAELPVRRDPLQFVLIAPGI